MDAPAETLAPKTSDAGDSFPLKWRVLKREESQSSPVKAILDKRDELNVASFDGTKGSELDDDPVHSCQLLKPQ